MTCCRYCTPVQSALLLQVRKGRTDRGVNQTTEQRVYPIFNIVRPLKNAYIIILMQYSIYNAALGMGPVESDNNTV